LTLSFGRTKADAMTQVIHALKPDLTLALGDAPNDVEMLEQADLGVIVANPHHASLPLLAGERDGRIIRTRDPGPVGWNIAVNEILDRLFPE
jgi:mannosyl-3-phosphoglycerate phosphatase